MGEGDAEGGRLRRQPVRDGERVEATVEAERVHRQLGPVDVLLDEHAPEARLRERRRDRGLEPGGVVDEREPALPLPVGRLHDARERERGVVRVERPRVRDPGRGERLALPALRRGERAAPGVDRVRQADPVGDARRDPHRPVGARRDDPRHVAGAREAVDPLLVLRREHGALVGEREPDRARVAVDGDHVEVGARPRGLEQAELGRAGP